jgi:hypothetical protein
MNSTEKFLLDAVLVGLIVVLVWTGWRRSRQDEQDKEPC